MLKLEGLVVNVYKAPDFKPKEGEKKRRWAQGPADDRRSYEKWGDEKKNS